MDSSTLIAGMDFSRTRLLNTLGAIETGPPDTRLVLAWRPGPGRAHIAWQAMHCAATHDKYLNVAIKGGSPTDGALVEAFGGGSTPSDDHVPDLETIRSALETHYAPLKQYVAELTPAEMQRKLANGRTVVESILMLTWHEAHHQGQIHLTLNLHKQSAGTVASPKR